MIKFGPWTPDDRYAEGGLNEALNVIPVSGGYRALPTEPVISV